MLDRPHLAGPTGPGLNLVGDQKDPVLVADPAQALQEAVLRDDIAALALDRLDDDRGDLIGRGELVEQDLVEPAQVVDAPIRRMEDARQEGSEASVVLGLRGRERNRPVGAPMERAEERDHVRPLRGESSQLDRGLDNFRPGIAEIHAFAPGYWRNSGKLSAYFWVNRLIEVRGAEMDQLGGLLADRRDDLRMGVTGRGDRDPGGEVEEQVAVDVLDRQAVPPDRNDRIGARETWRRPGLIEFDVGPCFRTGQLRDDVRNGPVSGDPRSG